MNGIQDYENRLERKISHKLSSCPELKGYLNYIRTKNALTTSYNYLLQVSKFIEQQNKDFNEITFDDYVSYLNSLRGNTNGYQRNVYFALKHFSEYLVFSRKTTINYMENVTPPKNIESIRTREKREKGFLTKEEIEEMFENADYDNKWKERDLAILYVFLTTGIRCSALFKLDLNSIDWQNSTLIVIDKGSKIHKYVLPNKTINALQKWIAKRNEILNGEKEDALFISYQKRRLGNLTISNIVKKYADNINGKHITPHKLRATFGTQLYNETRDIKFVQDQMGHSNPQTTELYIRGNQDADKQKAADIMAKFLS